MNGLKVAFEMVLCVKYKATFTILKHFYFPVTKKVENLKHDFFIMCNGFLRLVSVTLLNVNACLKC